MILRSLWCMLFLTAPVGAAQPDVRGKLDRIGPFRIVRVWGSPQEMGFAHGYLVGADFVADLRQEVAALEPKQRETYDNDRDGLLGAISIPGPALEELRGILKGITAAMGQLPDLAGLGRPLRVEDLVFYNAGDTLRAFGCSGMTVWGKQAGHADVVTLRNFDFPVATREALARQMILVRHPAGGHQVATVTWPGYIGAFTGLNDEGVCMFLHDGTGPRIGTPKGKYTPAALVLADVLASSSAVDAHKRAEAAMKAIVPYPFSYMVRVVTPRIPGKVDVPARVFRIDGAGLSENPVRSFFSITTNHYLQPDFQPVPGSSRGSIDRLHVLTSHLRATVDRAVAWNALRAVVSPAYTGAPTLHSLVVYPKLRRLQLAFATWSDRIVAAPESRMVADITFDELFAGHD